MTPEPRPNGVLVTRPEPGGSATAAHLARLGRRPVLAPMLTIETLNPVLPDTATIQAILVTSANALPGLPATLHGIALLSVGDATAAVARSAGFHDVVSAAGDAQALATLCASRCTPSAGSLLVAAGHEQGNWLANRLQRSGFTVLRATLYAAHPATTLPAPALREWRDGTLDAAMFLSAETARAFVRAIAAAAAEGHAAGVEALAIGAAAADALAALPWRRVRVADRPNQDALLALLS